MPVISFKPEFLDLIRSRQKQQTIRGKGKRAYKKDDVLFMYTGRYTSSDRVKIGEAVVAEVIKVRITFDFAQEKIIEILLDDFSYNLDNLEILAKEDGFASVKEFTKFFYSIKSNQTETIRDALGGKRRVKRFYGNLIVWKDFKLPEDCHC